MPKKSGFIRDLRIIQAVVPKVKPDTNADEILALLEK